MKRSIVGALLLSAGMAAHAEGVYVGASVGSTDFENNDIVALTANLDSKDTGVKFLVGFEVAPAVNIELSYVDPGETSLSGGAGDTFILDGDAYVFLADGKLAASGNAFTVSGIYSFEAANSPLSFFGRLGVAMWEADYSISSTAGSASFSDDGSDLYYGFGLQYEVSQAVSIRAEYEMYDMEGDVDMLGVGIVIDL